MADLLVPTPIAKFDQLTPGVALLEQPGEIRSAPVTFADGTNFELTDLGVAGFFIYRTKVLGAPMEIWNEEAKTWQPDPGRAIAGLKVKKLALKTGEPTPWFNVFAAAGEKQIEPAQSGFPQYSFRTYFEASSGEPGFSALTPAIQFIPLLETMLTGLELGPSQTPQNATLARFFLRTPAKRNIGMLELKAATPGSPQVEIASFDSAGNVQSVIRLLSNGNIELRPAATGRVIIAGLLETENILYLPSLGTTKQFLS